MTDSRIMPNCARFNRAQPTYLHAGVEHCKPARKSPWYYLTLLGVCLSSSVSARNLEDILNLDLEQLMSLRVEAVAHRAQELRDIAAAVYVITADDIARSSALSVPDLLRIVPGLEVAQIDANKWAISARSFNGRQSSKLLVIVDGRSVISPTYANTNWETMDLVLDEIERIEIIRGPGASIWGAIAVNGVINIITKSAAETRGFNSSVATRFNGGVVGATTFGSSLNETTDYRVFAKFRNEQELDSVSGGGAKDSWTNHAAGFRVDGQPDAANVYTFQGEYSAQDMDQLLLRNSFTPALTRKIDDQVQHRTTNLQGRWHHTNTDGSVLSTQAFVDSQRHRDLTLHEKYNTYDLDLSWKNAASHKHNLTLGIGYRLTRHEVTPTRFVSLNPSTMYLSRTSMGLRDDISLSATTIVGFALKLEQNSFTGLEYIPNISINHRLSPRQNLWASLTRSVRVPGRGERNLVYDYFTLPAGTVPFLPARINVEVRGSDDFDVEVLRNLEVGWRYQSSASSQIDVVAYYNDYDELRSMRVGQLECVPEPSCAPVVDYIKVPFLTTNGDAALSYGLETMARWNPRPELQLEASFHILGIEYESTFTPFLNLNQQQFLGDVDGPLYKGVLKANWNLANQTALGLALRAVSDPGFGGLAGYVVADLHYRQQLNKHVSWVAAARNLGGSHVEFQEYLITTPSALIEPYYYLQLQMHW